MTLPKPPMMAAQPLLPARQLPPTLPAPPPASQHQYALPPNCAGQAVTRLRHHAVPALPIQPAPQAPAPLAFGMGHDEFVVAVEEVGLGIELPPHPPHPAPQSTEYKRRRRLRLGVEGGNVRTKEFNCCRKCGLPKTKDTGHSCLKGHVFCPHEEGEDNEIWHKRVSALIAQKKLHKK